MPELPEVETIRQDLRKKILNKKIVDLVIFKKAKIRSSKISFKKEFKNKKFIEIERIGKMLIFVLSDKKYLLIHLKMTGQLIYQKGKQIIPGGHNDLSSIKNLPNKFTWVEFNFLDKSKLFFNNIRGFGYLKIVDKNELEKIKNNYGIEPLQSNFTFKKFKALFKDRKTSVKAILLNQKLIAGIGNIYADESCFLAKIKPMHQAGNLTEQEIKKIYKAVQKIIKKAIKARGTSFNNYVDADGQSGNFVKTLKVYGRSKLKCKRCYGILLKTKVAGRGTVYCPFCQK